MTEWERVSEACKNASDALVKLGEALANRVIAAVKTIASTLNVDAIFEAAAYTKAKKEHPEWVHKAKYSKKKRIRKKYHDRIMLQYWRA